MKRYRQKTLTKIGENGSIGDCWATSIACILEIPQKDVPNFAAIEVEDEESTKWWEETQRFVREHGYEIIEWEIPEEGAWAPDGYTILTGRSPRGDWSHSVVGWGMRVIHDPHPSGAGLDGPPKRMAVFVATNPRSTKSSGQAPFNALFPRDAPSNTANAEVRP